jgi:hypothetical protein
MAHVKECVKCGIKKNAHNPIFVDYRIDPYTNSKFIICAMCNNECKCVECLFCNISYDKDVDTKILIKKNISKNSIMPDICFLCNLLYRDPDKLRTAQYNNKLLQAIKNNTDTNCKKLLITTINNINTRIDTISNDQNIIKVKIDNIEDEQDSIDQKLITMEDKLINRFNKMITYKFEELEIAHQKRLDELEITYKTKFNKIKGVEDLDLIKLLNQTRDKIYDRINHCEMIMYSITETITNYERDIQVIKKQVKPYMKLRKTLTELDKIKPQTKVENLVHLYKCIAETESQLLILDNSFKILDIKNKGLNDAQLEYNEVKKEIDYKKNMLEKIKYIIE